MLFQLSTSVNNKSILIQLFTSPTSFLDDSYVPFGFLVFRFLSRWPPSLTRISQSSADILPPPLSPASVYWSIIFWLIFSISSFQTWGFSWIPPYLWDFWSWCSSTETYCCGGKGVISSWSTPHSAHVRSWLLRKLEAWGGAGSWTV